MRSRRTPSLRAAPPRVREGLALAPNEERYVLSEAMASETFGNPWAVRIKGRLDEARLRDAIQRMCDRHEARRTGFEPGPDGHFTRYVETVARPDVRFVSMVGAPATDVRRAIRSWGFERCDLSPHTLNRFLVIRTAADEHLFANYLHHAVNDGETHNAANSEIIDNYAGREPAEPAVQYSDLWDWDWRASPAYLEGEAFWRQFLGDVTDVGELPADGGDPGDGAWGGPARVSLPPDLAAAALRAAKQAGVSEFAFYYAVAQVLFTRLTGVDRVCSTFQSGGRRSVPGSEGVHGVFSNGLVLATRVDEQESIAALAARLRGEIRQALAHEAYPYHHVIQATGLRPRFGINWYPDVVFPDCPGLEIFQPDMDFGTWEYDLNVRFVRQLATGGVDIIIYFREASISRGRAVAAAEQFAAMLAAFAGDIDAPIAQVRSADLTPPGLLPDPTAPLPVGGGELIHARFLEQAARRPQATAIVHDDQRLTYSELEQRSRALAARLAAEGVGPGDRLAIVAERGPALVWSMLAAARLGAVFVVLDAAYPEPRLARLLEMCRAKALALAGGRAIEDVGRRLAGAAGLPVVDVAGGLDAEGVVLPALDDSAADQPAYCLFTSGSTGEPKGVVCSHAPLSHFVEWQARTYRLDAGDRFTLLGGLSHDPVLRDIFTPLSLGATLLIPRQDQINEPGALASWLRRSAATVAHATPALGRLIAAGGRPRSLPRLRRIFWGGDRLPPALVRDVAALAPDARQVNFYGATETPQAVAAFDCEDGLDRLSVPIGRGVAGNQLLVVDPSGAQVGLGEAGEIAVRSAFPALGYLDGETIAPFPSRGRGEGGGLYYTGDRAISLPGGEVMVLGRADDQIKVRGHRVELSEVTTALLAHPAVREAHTLSLGEDASLQIVAFAVLRRRDRTTPAELTGFLAAHLPGYMQPRAIRLLDALPVNANGKVDLKALVALAETTPGTPAQAAAPENDAERALIESWARMLGEDVSRDSTFAGLGGDSLSFVQVFLETERVIGVVPDRWQFMPISELAQAVQARHRLWSEVDLTVLTRAVSIVLIVSGHFGLIRYGGGAVHGMMLVSGFMFGGLQLTDVFAKKDPTPILRTLRNILVPTALMTLAIVATRWAQGIFEPYAVTLTADFQSIPKLPDLDAYPPAIHTALWRQWPGHDMHLWYVHCLMHMMVLLYLALLGLKLTGGFRFGLRRFLLVAFAVTSLGRFWLPSLFVPHFFTQGVPQFIFVYFLPTTHLPTLLLGGLIATSKTVREKLQVLPLLAAYAALTAWFYSPPQALFLFAAGLTLMTVTRMRLPRVIAPVIFALSGASLFIYLGQYMARDIVAHFLGRSPLAVVAVALAGGVALWLAWVRGLNVVSDLLRRPLPVQADATV